VQKDIIAWSREAGAVATMSFIDQTFSQIDCLDFDADGDVDSPDLARMFASFGQSVPPWSLGDCDGDGDVDGGDFMYWQRNVSRGASHMAPASAVPEPQSTALTVMVAFAVACFGRLNRRRQNTATA